MPKSNIFFDSSALIAGIVSSQGAARALLLLSEDDKIVITVSEQVIVEVERNLARKVSRALPLGRELVLRANICIVHDPPPEELHQRRDWMSHQANLPILVAAFLSRVDFLVTLNTRHFVVDPQAALRSGLRIGTPGDALSFVRARLTEAGKPE